MDRRLGDKALAKLKRKIEEELGSFSESSVSVAEGEEGQATAMTPGGTVVSKPAGSSKKQKTSKSKGSEGPSSRLGSAALQGLDLETLAEMIRHYPDMRKLLEELA